MVSLKVVKGSWKINSSSLTTLTSFTNSLRQRSMMIMIYKTKRTWLSSLTSKLRWRICKHSHSRAYQWLRSVWLLAASTYLWQIKCFGTSHLDYSKITMTTRMRVGAGPCSLQRTSTARTVRFSKWLEKAKSLALWTVHSLSRPFRAIALCVWLERKARVLLRWLSS